MLRTLITGGSGFIGTNACEHFLSLRHEVLNLDSVAPRNPTALAPWMPTDICNSEALTNAVVDFAPDLIFHLAARTDLDGTTLSDYLANTVGVQNIIAAALATSSVKRVVFASSRLVCEIGYSPSSDSDYCPPNFYGQSKVVGEQLVRARAVNAPWSWIIVRPTSIWGPWFGVPYKLFFESVVRGRYVHPRGADILKSFGFVGNTVRQLAALAAAPDGQIDRKTLYLADYPPIHVHAMANLIRSEIGLPPVRQVPVWMLKAMACAGDLAKGLGMRPPPLTSFRLANLVTPMVYNLTPLEQIAGPLPFDMAAGVRQTLAWMRLHGEVK
jgi:nucleoside-diphosphate-sugar epimerase